ncbi:hypothetical protein Taro_020289 [Colocasia esculenta]|uniref:Oxidative stress 3 n=1 Tax=Colocasia esculenta TaxID=4460 RepID=A0A843UW14_COLES|nr:hypothetical protein [Colocasia esculenta]
MEASLLFVPQISHGIMDEEEEDELGTPSSSSSSCCDSAGSNGSSSSELADDATSKLDQNSQGRPYEMASLKAELPLKRGLSRHFQGKSQSFTCLANVRCLEDLVKPERPCRKKLKSCRSYAAGLDSQRPRSPTLNGCSKAISKRPRGSGAALPSLVVKRPGFLGGGRPPVRAPPHRSSSFSAQTLLFA